MFAIYFRHYTTSAVAHSRCSTATKASVFGNIPTNVWVVPPVPSLPPGAICLPLSRLTDLLNDQGPLEKSTHGL